MNNFQSLFNFHSRFTPAWQAQKAVGHLRGLPQDNLSRLPPGNLKSSPLGARFMATGNQTHAVAQFPAVAGAASHGPGFQAVGGEKEFDLAQFDAAAAPRVQPPLHLLETVGSGAGVAYFNGDTLQRADRQQANVKKTIVLVIQAGLFNSTTVESLRSGWR